MKIWLKNTDGKPSASFTMMIVGFFAVTLWFSVSIVEKVGPVPIRPFSGSEASLYLGPLIALYFGRRGQDIKVNENANSPEATPKD